MNKMEELMKQAMYIYRGKVVKVFDGDTVYIDVDHGFSHTARKFKINLSRINAPELRRSNRAKGRESKDFLKALLLGEEVVFRTIKKGSDYTAEIYFNNENVSDKMVVEGYAVYK